MDHKELRESLAALHDGELSGTPETELTAHMRECGECRQEYQRLQDLARAVFGAQPQTTGHQTELFVQRVMSRLEAEESAPLEAWRRWLGTRWLLPALSMGVAVLFLSILSPRMESIMPMDVLFLMGGQNRSAAQLVLPPDPANSDNMLAFVVEDK